ncbi:MAG: hypothetical protein NTZ80_00895 [Patescibacteria group bacterium]|nr:hypothetical protein [Patescibacteria group bacterium]
MNLQKLSLSAYLLLRSWEKEDKRLFRKFRQQEGAMEIINALAEMIAQAESEKIPETLIHF